MSQMSLTSNGDFRSRMFLLLGPLESSDLLSQLSGSGYGGITFQGYELGDYTVNMPLDGTNILAIYTGTSSVNMPFFEDFESFPTGSFTTQTASTLGFSMYYAGNVTGSV